MVDGNFLLIFSNFSDRAGDRQNPEIFLLANLGKNPTYGGEDPLRRIKTSLS